MWYIHDVAAVVPVGSYEVIALDALARYRLELLTEKPLPLPFYSVLHQKFCFAVSVCEHL